MQRFTGNDQRHIPPESVRRCTCDPSDVGRLSYFFWWSIHSGTDLRYTFCCSYIKKRLPEGTMYQSPFQQSFLSDILSFFRTEGTKSSPRVFSLHGNCFYPVIFMVLAIPVLSGCPLLLPSLQEMISQVRSIICPYAVPECFQPVHSVSVQNNHLF